MKLLIASIAALTVSATLIAAPTTDEAADNLIVNGDFEEQAGENPRGWTVHAGNAERVDAESAGEESVHSGRFAVRLSEPASYQDRWVTTNNTRPSVDSASTYRMTAWVKVDDLVGSNGEFVQLRLEQFDADGSIFKPFLYGPQERPEPGVWTEITADFEVSPEANTVRPLLVLSHNGRESSTAAATFDDVRFEMINE